MATTTKQMHTQDPSLLFSPYNTRLAKDKGHTFQSKPPAFSSPYSVLRCAPLSVVLVPPAKILSSSSSNPAPLHHLPHDCRYLQQRFGCPLTSPRQPDTPSCQLVVATPTCSHRHRHRTGRETLFPSPRSPSSPCFCRKIPILVVPVLRQSSSSVD